MFLFFLVSSYRNPQLSNIQKQHIKQRESEIVKPVLIKRRVRLTPTTKKPLRPIPFYQISTSALPPQDVTTDMTIMAAADVINSDMEEVNAINSDTKVMDDDNPQPQQQHSNGSLTIAGDVLVIFSMTSLVFFLFFY